jgi:coproporphyrinogen III oxidase-like Fe-S oxidoreductase
VYCNHAEIDAYVDAVLAGQDPIALAKPVNALEEMSRFFVLGLKFFTASRSQFILRFGLTPEQVFGDVLERLKREELIVLEDDRYVLARAARRYVNNVAKEFFVGASRGLHQNAQFVSNLTVEQIEMYAERRARAEASGVL